MRSRFCLPVVALLMLISLASAPIAVGAPLLQMDFGRFVPDSPLQSDFLNMSGASVQATATATFGAYTVDLAGQGFFNTTNATAVNALDASIRNFYRDYYYNNSTTPGVGVQLSITGVTPNTPYNLTLWSFDAQSSTTIATPTTWNPVGNTTGGNTTISNIRTPTPSTLLDPDNSATIQVMSTTNKLELFGTTTSGSSGTRLNGFILNDGAIDQLKVDFAQAGAGNSPLQAGFVGAYGTDSQSAFSQTEGAYTVSLAGQGFFNTTSSGGLGLLDPSVEDLYRDYYYNNSTTPGVGVQLSIAGITPNTGYDLTIWSYDADQVTATPTTWTPNGNTTGPVGMVTNVRTPAPATLYSAGNSTTIRVSSTSGTLEIFGTTTSGNGGTRINAIELNPVPEPSAIVLAGITAIVVGLGIRRR